MHKQRVQIIMGVLILVLTTSTGLCFGWGESWEEIRRAAASIESIQADFVQEKHMKMLVQPLISEGRLVYRSPGAMRWEYRRPIENVLLMDAGNMQRFIKSNGVWEPEAGADLTGMQVVMEQITQWFAGRFDDLPFFTAALETTSEGIRNKIVLIPKDAGAGKMIERVELSLSVTPGVMDAVTIYENSDSFTKIMFTHPIVNQPIEDVFFKKIQ